MRICTWFFLSLVLVTVAGSAAPVVNTGSVVNAASDTVSCYLSPRVCVNTGGVVNMASYTPAALSHGGIAQGSIFAVFGTNLGPANIAYTNYPLPTTLAGTSVQVTSGGTTLNAFLIYSSDKQVAAILPSGIPTGTGSLTVTYNGETSNPVSFQIVPSTFGIFTVNAAGSGPAIAQNFNSSSEQPFNNLVTAAHQGQMVTLWGTGLGQIGGDDNQRPHAGTVGDSVTVLVGGQPATVQYHGRSPCCAGEDQINFVVPEGAEGCYLPVAVQVNGVPSNIATIAVSPDGNTCFDPNGLSASELQRIQAGGSFKVGTIGLIPDDPDEAYADFEQSNAATVWEAATLLHETRVAAGNCIVNAGYGGLPRPSFKGLLEAGPSLAISGPNGTKQLQKDVGFEQYDAFFLGAPFSPGLYTVTGPSGADVGSFQATINIPSPPFNWTNKDSIQTIPRSQGLLITWSGGDPNSIVEINGYSSVGGPMINVSFQCTANATAGQFTVPSAILSLLPPSSNIPPAPSGVLRVFYTIPGRFQATGLDFGFIEFRSLFNKDVIYQ
jgi:uncharacterized protein (TIGR03437 family)